jgi:TM2 domain-containing membrane protein YozV
MVAVPISLPKSSAAAGLLQLFFGTFGIGRFYIGSTAVAVVQLVLSLTGLFFTMFCLVGIVILIPLWVWTFVDAMLMSPAQSPTAKGASCNNRRRSHAR